MELLPNQDYLSSIKAQLKHFKSLGDQTFAQIKDDSKLFWKPTSASNDIWILVKHLSGNMIARFTDIFTSDGEAGRQRDAEFTDGAATRKEVLATWEKGWKRMFDTLDSLSEADLQKEVHLKNKPISLIDFLNQAILHYLYHIGQIVFIGKMAVNDDWTMLWGPKKK